MTGSRTTPSVEPVEQAGRVLPLDILGAERQLPDRVGRLGGTPGRLKLLGGLVAALCVGFGLVGGGTSDASVQSISLAQADLQQVVRAQSVAADLLRADVIATNGYLVAGVESGDQLAAYDDALRSASDLVMAAGAAQPADQEALGLLNRSVLRYAEVVEHGRTASREGLPVGHRYQQNASRDLRGDALPLVAAVIDANETRLGASVTHPTRGHTGWPAVQGALFAVILAVTLVALVGLSWWTALRTHRRLNPGLVAAGLVVLSVGGATLAVQLYTVQRMQQFATGVMREATIAAEARTLAYDARANENLFLMARGSGERYEKAFEAATATLADRQAELGLPAQTVTGFVEEFRAARDLDAAGDRDGAVALIVTSPSAFDRLDAELTGYTDQRVSAAAGDLRAPDALPVLRWVLPPAGVLAALLVWWGVGRAVNEYR